MEEKAINMASVPENPVSFLRYKDWYQICDLQGNDYRKSLEWDRRERREKTVMIESNVWAE